MSTADDVFCLYERNSRHYHDCVLKNNIEECSSSFRGECYCYSKQEVKPFTIGDQDMPCELNIRCYIKPGDECPICYENIQTKSAAFITNCGHHYHKSCLFNYIKIKWLSSSYASVVRCPMCRCSLGHPDFMQRYRSSYFTPQYKNDNQLDKLEDFWLTHDYRLPEFCSNGYSHYLGCNKECYICKVYRQTGNDPLSDFPLCQKD